MPSGVGLLSQVLGSTLEANRRNAMWRAEQEQQNELAAAQMQAQKENLASQLKAHLLSQLVADATKNVAMAQSYDRQEAADKARDARAANLEAWRMKRIDDMDKAREARDAARLKGMLDLEAARAANAQALKRTPAPPTTRRTITERVGDNWGSRGGGQQPDVRRTPEWNAYERASKNAIRLEDAYSKMGAMLGDAPSSQLLEARQRLLLTQKEFDDKFGQNARMAAESTITTGPGMLARPDEDTRGVFLQR